MYLQAMDGSAGLAFAAGWRYFREAGKRHMFHLNEIQTILNIESSIVFPTTDV